jgi:hypothetical protein
MPVDLETGDLVWVRWTNVTNPTFEKECFPTVIVTAYDDGNIIHKRASHNKEFAWGYDIIAKSPDTIYDNRLAWVIYNIDAVKEAVIAQQPMEVEQDV